MARIDGEDDNISRQAALSCLVAQSSLGISVQDMSSINTSNPSTPRTTTSTPPTTRNENEVPQIVQDFKQRSKSERFKRWRPLYHVQAPQGWMNDPCAPGYNAKTGLYHVSFQSNPHGNDWGDIAWCSATSPDMINWTIDSQPSLSPDQPYDCEAVFTGCLVHGQDGSMNYLYTSASSLPIHHTLQHVRGSESLSIASSYDNGKTWMKSLQNPILPNEPESYDVTGWRDPYVAQWPSMSALLGLDNERTLFGVISGGIRDVTPTTFLYTVNANNLTEWRFVDPIVNVGLNREGDRWSGDYGRNWEVTNFCTLKDEINPSLEKSFLIMGTEGRNSDRLEAAANDKDSFRPYRNQLWMSVFPQKDGNGVTVRDDFSGVLDHGCMYAANSFYDPLSERQVVWGWITEDDLSDELRQPQGWSGMLSLPRELRMQTIQNVIGTCASDLTSISSLELQADDIGSYTVRTLASQPCPTVVEALRRGPNVRRKDMHRASLRQNQNIAFTKEDIWSEQWELNCSFKLSERYNDVGIRIKDSHGGCVTLRFSPQTETFTIERPALLGIHASDLINESPESAAHALFRIKDSSTGVETLENLEIRAWRDNSVLEVFVNGRTAISTRLYAAGQNDSIAFFAEGFESGDTSIEIVRATLWDGIGIR